MQSPIPIPGEHGAWALLYAPFALGLAAAGRVDFSILLFFLAITALFFSHEPLSQLARLRGETQKRRRRYLSRWLLADASVALLAGLSLLLFFGRPQLISFGLLGGLLLGGRVYLASRRQDRTLAGELLAVFGLTLTAPASLYVLTGELGLPALALWAICLVYFASGIFYVRMRVARFSRRPGAQAKIRQCTLYHLTLLLLLIPAALEGWISWPALAGFLLLVARALLGLGAPGDRLDLKRIGRRELTWTVLFVILFWAGELVS